MTKKVEVKISGEASGLQRAVGQATGSLRSLGIELRTVQSLASTALSLGGLGGAASLAGVAAMVKSVANAGDAIAKMSQRTGVGVEELQRLQYASEMSGATNEVLEKSLIKLSQSMSANSPAFTKLGISVTDASGKMRSNSAVFAEIADRFAALPDGVEKTTLAVQIFGKSGAELIPTLNSGAAGLQEMGDEAQRLGIIIGEGLAKQSEQFNDNLTRLQKLARGVGIAIGGELLPAMGAVLQRIIDANKAGVFLRPDQLFGAEDVEKSIGRVRRQLAALKDGKAGFITSVFGNPEEAKARVSALEKQLVYLEMQRDRMSGKAEQSEAAQNKLLDQQKELKAELLRLSGLQAAKSKDDITSAERLRDALSKAWQASVDGAKAARLEADKLFERAADAAQSLRDKAAGRRNQSLPEGQQSAAAAQQAEAATRDASFAALRAKMAAMRGDTEAAEKLSADALKNAARAEKFADAVKDDRTAAGILDELAGIQETALKAQAEAKKAQAQQLDEQAAAQQQKLGEIEQQLSALREAAGSIDVDVEISQAMEGIAALRAEIEKGATMPIRTSGGATGSFATGGYVRGPGSGTSDSILARLSNGEYVMKAAAVQRYGPAFMSAINNLQLPKFASGGPVGKSAASSTPLVLDFGKLGRFQAESSADTSQQILRVFQRAAMAKGRR